MAKVKFNTDICKGCGLCVNVCPKKILIIAKEKINKKGYYPAEITNEALCIGCGFCYTMCPDSVITIEK